MDCSRQSTGPANKIENEIKGYQNHEFSSTDEALIQKHGPLLFFKENSSKFPLLSNLAKAVFSAMPSSTPVENLFSGAKETANPLRNRANPEQVANLTLLKRNKLE